MEKQKEKLTSLDGSQHRLGDKDIFDVALCRMHRCRREARSKHLRHGSMIMAVTVLHLSGTMRTSDARIDRDVNRCLADRV